MRVFRSLKLPNIVAANLQLKSRKPGFTEAQSIEAIVLLQTAGGDCPEDMSLLQNDVCLEKGRGYAFPKTNTVRDFRNLFHAEVLAPFAPSANSRRASFDGCAPRSGPPNPGGDWFCDHCGDERRLGRGGG